MRVTLGRKGEYSVRAVLDVVQHRAEGRRKAREIAGGIGVPEQHLRQVLAELVRANLLMAVAGPSGGYSLAREPEAITLLDVVEAAEGPVGLERCALRGGPYDPTDPCPVHDTWSRAQSALSEELQATTVAELAEYGSLRPYDARAVT